jgi:hypothetical protein
LKIKKKIDAYNKNLHTIYTKIEQLKWEDSIEFEGKYYGIQPVTRFKDTFIHNENNCKGIFNFVTSEGCKCHSCEDWYGCSNPSTTTYYKCNICSYQYVTHESTGKNYKGK